MIGNPYPIEVFQGLPELLVCIAGAALFLFAVVAGKMLLSWWRGE